VIPHALRFTVHETYGYFWPARHLTSGDRDDPYDPDSLIPPMGARFRLKAGFNLSGFSPEMQVILRTMKRYGILIADNGSDWYLSGAPDQRWDNDMLHELDALTGKNFEAVDTACMIAHPVPPAQEPNGEPDSGQADLTNCP
jgi:hypothetical protein